MAYQNECFTEELASKFKFCVYLHKKPDGSVFYVGKGTLSRAHDFAPSRRTLWHKNIVAKYGKDAIQVQVIPCLYEQEAFELEMAHISILKASGVNIVNLTDGGEGVSGRKATEKQLEALSKGRLAGKKNPGTRPQFAKWIQSDEFKAMGAKNWEKALEASRAPRLCTCAECGKEFEARSAKAVCCSRLCEQRYRRAGKNKASA